MFFSLFDAEAAKAFGHELAQFYIDRSPSGKDLRGDKSLEKRQKELLSKMSLKIEQFKNTRRLNFYQKSQAINVFKWRLLDVGYEKPIVDELSHWIVRQI
jgi:hypothetical protein